MNGYPNAKSFTYQFDCGDGTGYRAAQTPSFAKCPTRAAGTRTVRGTVIDQEGDTASYAMTIPVKFRPDTVKFTSTAPISPVMGTTYAASVKTKSGLPVTLSTTSSECSASGSVITFANIGTCTINADAKGDSVWAPAVRATQSAKVIWPFTGFYTTTVRNPPIWNAMTAGRYVKLTFSLGGNRATSAPVVPSLTASTQIIACDPNVIPFNVTATTGVGTAGIEYDYATGRYVLTWKTDVAWKGTCRLVTVTLRDGTQHTLKFKFL